ncbi:MAG: ABC transporter permease subunit [Planctomycetes bacterium]|nr:ABC transporter permease subunit [Planctomycetota bacterium]MCB9890912.1 ABC transporter permease subunit [Planctomycetota bacterium]
MTKRSYAVLLALPFLLAATQSNAPQTPRTITIGSKNFTESAILAELMAQMIEAHTDIVVERKTFLGGTLLCWGALRDGGLDLYAEYTGTGWAIILEEPARVSDPLQTYLHVADRYARTFDIHWQQPFGFENTYALAMRDDQAERLGIRTTSDLLAHQQELRAGFSIEFMNREDGYPGLVDVYGLDFGGTARSLEHGLAYQAIRDGEIDVIDAYSTDGKLLRYDLRVLKDDRDLFPPYTAAPIVRGDTLERCPEIEGVLRRLAFRIPEASMQRMNDRVESDGLTFAAAAAEFLEAEGLLSAEQAREAQRERSLGEFLLMLGRLTWQHVLLTLSAVLLAALFAIPIGIAIVDRALGRRIALNVAGILQTIPSLALLALMVPIFDLSARAAIAALFLYAILPILRNTYTAIAEVDERLIEAARGMGMSEFQILWHVKLPLSTRTIMAGIRTATVICVGVATLAAFVSAGGYGEPILQGIYLDDHALILTGAIPAALLAILADFGLGRLEWRLTPRGLRETATP